MTVSMVKFTLSRRRALLAALPLAALVPLTSPLDAGGRLQIALGERVVSLRVPDALARSLAGLGTAEAAAKKKATKKTTTKKASAKKAPATTKTVCTVKKVKGKKVKTCKTTKVTPPPPPAAQQMDPAFQTITAAPMQLKQTALPPAPVPPPPPAPPPPPVYREPPPPPVVSYFWIDLADSFADAIGNSPPDFTFRYDGIDSWAWVSRAGEMLIVEPGRDGIIQYYFGANESAPYLVRDSYYSYAFDGYNLVQVYDNNGRLWTADLSSRQQNDYRNYQDRGRALFSASWRQRRWDSETAYGWNSYMNSYSYSYGWGSNWSGGWRGEWRQRPEWPNFEYEQRRGHPPRYLEEERRNRGDARWRYDNWQNGGHRGAPPPTGNPIIQQPPEQPAPPPAPPPPPKPKPQPAPPAPPPPAPPAPPAPPPPPPPAPVPPPLRWQPPAPPPPPPPAPPPPPPPPPPVRWQPPAPPPPPVQWEPPAPPPPPPPPPPAPPPPPPAPPPPPPPAPPPPPPEPVVMQPEPPQRINPRVRVQDQDPEPMSNRQPDTDRP